MNMRKAAELPLGYPNNSFESTVSREEDVASAQDSKELPALHVKDTSHDVKTE